LQEGKDAFALLGKHGLFVHFLFEAFGRDDAAPEEFLAHLAPDTRGQNGILGYQQVNI
jgi:hypothetical protein